MPAPADRMQGWIETLSKAWGAALGKWSAGFVAAGIEGILDILGKKQAKQLKPVIDELRKAGVDETILKPIIDEVGEPTGESAFSFGLGLFNKVTGSIKADVFEYFTRSITHAMSYSAKFFLPDSKLLIAYKFQSKIGGDEFYDRMRDHGIPPEEADKLIDASRVRFPSDIAFQLWLRDPEKYGKFINDVTELGVDHEHLEALRELAYKLPTAQEAITWMAHEVFEPDSIKKYGLDDEFGKLDLTLLNQIGIRPDMAKNYWRSHWAHASWSQVVEMVHRGTFRKDYTTTVPPKTAAERNKADSDSREAVYDWFKLVEIPPFWRPGMIGTMWNVPGRVEARMLAQYGLVDKPFLVELLARDGLDPEYRDVVADMMLVRGIRTDIQTRYAKKWLDAAGVKTEIDKYGLSQQIADRLYQWIVSNAGPERTAPEKDLTAAELLKGYKKKVLSYDDAAQGLVDLGYDPAEAAYKIAIESEVVKDDIPAELATQIDTIRRQRRQRIITRSQEISQLQYLNVDAAVALAYADNDDMRLIKLAAEKPPEVIPEYQTDDGKVNVETIRLSRRQRRISRNEEIASLIDLEMIQELAVAYADNDDLRLVKVATE